jgi:hypothetical protein
LLYLGRALAGLLTSRHVLENATALALIYALLVGQMDLALVLAATAVGFARFGGLPGRAERSAIAALSSGAVIACVWYLCGLPRDERALVLSAPFLAIPLAAHLTRWLPRISSRVLLRAGAAGLLALATFLPLLAPAATRRTVAKVRARIQSRPYFDPAIVALARFARSASRPTDLFLIPPQLETFRELAERPVFVDFKLVPFDMRGFGEWWERLNLVTNQAPRREVKVQDLRFVPFMSRIHLLERGYASLREADALALSRRYGLRFMVTAGPRRLPFRTLFSNGAYTLYELAGDGDSSRARK